MCLQCISSLSRVLCRRTLWVDGSQDGLASVRIVLVHEWKQPIIEECPNCGPGRTKGFCIGIAWKDASLHADLLQVICQSVAHEGAQEAASKGSLHRRGQCRNISRIHEPSFRAESKVAVARVLLVILSQRQISTSDEYLEGIFDDPSISSRLVQSYHKAMEESMSLLLKFTLHLAGVCVCARAYAGRMCLVVIHDETNRGVKS